MSSVYATIDDIAVYGRKLTSQEQQAADSLIETACAKLRVIGKRYGVDVNTLVTSDEDYALTVKAIISKAVARSLDCSADNAPPAVQASQAAMGYSVSMTYLNSGQSLYFLKNELKELGIIRQRWGAMEVYDYENNDKGNFGEA